MFWLTTPHSIRSSPLWMVSPVIITLKWLPKTWRRQLLLLSGGTFCYKVMPFGLKNAGATYQRSMIALFHDMIHHEIEVYVDDMIGRSQTKEEHLDHLQKLFDRLKLYKLRLNSNKCTFGVRSGKLLGFVVSDKGIQVDPAKVKAIQEMPSPQTEKRSQRLSGTFELYCLIHLTPDCYL